MVRWSRRRLAAGGVRAHKAERRAPTPLDPATLGAITGEVRFAGTPPPSTKVDMSSAKDCAAQHPGPRLRR